jgi:hypothetical protein
MELKNLNYLTSAINFLSIITFATHILLNTAFASESKLLSGKNIPLQKNIMLAEDVSAIGQINDWFVIASDEATGPDEDQNIIHILEKKGATLQIRNSILLSNGKEMDIEGIEVNQRDIYVMGSHSLGRSTIKPTRQYQKNRKKFQQKKIKSTNSSDWLYRLRLNALGELISKDRVSLRALINRDPILKAFSQIPGKENGVDMEALAVKNDWLYIGFRGPVFRGNYVPVLKFRFASPQMHYELLFIKLAGRGIRGMTSVSDGFLLLSGPIGDGDASQQVIHWNGLDMVPGKNRKNKQMGKLQSLGTLNLPTGGKAEGILVTEENEKFYRAVISYDAVINKNSMLQMFQFAR